MFISLNRFFKLLAQIGRAWHGRPVALAWLGIFLIIVSFSNLSPFIAFRLALFDEFQSLYPRNSVSQPVIIIEIDEPTLNALGQWPWPRNFFAALIDSIASHKPSAIGLDIIMPEADHASPQAIAESRPDLPKEVIEILSKATSNDSLLATSISNAPTVLGSAGFSYRTSTALDGLRTREILTYGDNPFRWLNNYPFVLASLPEFQAAAKGQALLSNSPEKGVMRRISILTAINGSITPGLSLEIMRVAYGAPNITVNTGHHGIESASIGTKYIPLQSNGEAWLYFDKPSRHRYISALSVLKNEVPDERIRGKMVLIGLTGLGLQDMITTPTGEQRPGVEAHAQLIESFTDSKFLVRPWWMQWVEFGTLMAIGLIMIWLLPNAKIRSNSYKKNNSLTHLNKALSIGELPPNISQDRRKLERPGNKFRPKVVGVITIFLFLFLFGGGVLLFHWSGLLFDSVTLFIGLSVILGSLFFSASIEYEQQRKGANIALQNQRLKSAQMAGELNAARRIQLGTLPDARNAFPGETRFQIEAMLEPAQEVGGDLYDFFMIDKSRLFFIVGDVSGKGLPASLFMVVTKALAKSAALRENDNIGKIISMTNMELARENPQMLFVTGLAGVLNLENGVLELVNAGHDAPWLINKHGTIDRIEGSNGPPLGVMDEYDYPYKIVQLAIGDTLLCVTDGIYEAMNVNDELYGTERITEVLKSLGSKLSISKLGIELREDVRLFVGQAEPSDDITLLVLNWIGSSNE